MIRPRLTFVFFALVALLGCEGVVSESADEPALDSAAEPFSIASDVLSYGVADVPNNMPCLRDSAEPDDRFEMAGYVTIDEPAARSACTDDVDFFALAVHEGQRTRVTARFNRAEGDVEVMVTGPDGKFMGSSEIRGDRAEVDFMPEASGDHRVVVVLTGDRGGADGTTYTLRTSFPDEPCQADGSEPNDNADDTTALADGAQNLTACGADEDWFSFDASEGDTIRVSVDSLVEDGDVDFALYSPDGEFQGGSFGNEAYAEFDTEASVSGEWRVLVYLGEGSGQGVPYDVYLSVGSSADGQQ